MPINPSVKTVSELINDKKISGTIAEKLLYQAYLREKTGQHQLTDDGFLILLNDGVINEDKLQEIFSNWIPIILDDGSLIY